MPHPGHDTWNAETTGYHPPEQVDRHSRNLERTQACDVHVPASSGQGRGPTPGMEASRIREQQEAAGFRGEVG